MFEKLFRPRSKSGGKLATDHDSERPYFSGLLLRFDEEHAEAISFFSKVNPRFTQPPLPEGASESIRAGVAAYGLALGIACEAMGAQGKLMIDVGEVSIFEGAIGLSYAMFIFTLFSGYLKDDRIQIESKPVASGFTDLFVYLDDAQRKELAKKGIEIFKDMIGSDHQKVKEWHDTLSKAIQLWLISATSDKRTKENDEDFRKIFAGQLSALYKAVE